MGSNVRSHDPKSPGGGAPGGGSPTGPTGPAAPVAGSLDPGTAAVGGPDITMEINGSGFVPGSVIFFNGGAETTTVVSATKVSTIVRPSTASGPWTVPVWVQNGTTKSNELSFSFFEPGTTTAAAKPAAKPVPPKPPAKS